MNLLVPIALIPPMKEFPDQAVGLIAIGFILLGIGALLFIAIFALLMVRLATQSSVPNAMVPSLWMSLAPAGVFGVAIIRLFQVSVQADLMSPDFLILAEIFALMGIGFGLWWAVFAAIDLRRAMKDGGIPFHLGWWGIVFPVVAMALSINLIDQLLGDSEIIPLIVTGVGVGVRLVVSIKTVTAVLTHRSVLRVSPQ